MCKMGKNSQKAYHRYAHAYGYPDASFEQRTLRTEEGYTCTSSVCQKQWSDLPGRSSYLPMIAVAAAAEKPGRQNYCPERFAARMAAKALQQ